MKSNGSTLLVLGGAAALLFLMASGAKASNEALEAAELADAAKPKPKPKPDATKPKPKPKPEQATYEPPPDVAPAAVRPPPQSPSVDVVIGPAVVHDLPTGYNAAAALAEAPGLAKHIRAKGARYTRSAVATFQTHAGVKADGLYGPQTASALTYWSGSPAPKPLFKGSVKVYTPPEG